MREPWKIVISFILAVAASIGIMTIFAVLLNLFLIFASGVAQAEPIRTRLNVNYLRPDESSEFARNIPTLEEQKAWVRKALEHLPVKLKIVREVVGLDTCTKEKHRDFYQVLFCYKRIAQKYKLRRKRHVITLAVTPPYVLPDGRLYYRGYSNSICGISSLPYGFTYSVAVKNDETRSIEFIRHELMHLLGASHDNTNSNLMTQSIFTLYKIGEYLGINLKARKQLKFCYRRMRVKYDPTGY